MQVGIVVRNMGPQSSRETLVGIAHAVDAAPGIADLWVADHVAIPPDDAEGSDGRYLDPELKAPLCHSCHELCHDDWHTHGIADQAGAETFLESLELRLARLSAFLGRVITDETLAFLDRCFASDVVEANGQPFLFRPRPPRPPLFLGGQPPYAFRRALAHRAGWMPIGLGPDALAEPVAQLRAAAAKAALPAPEVAILTALPLGDRSAARDMLARYGAAGATRVIHGSRYADAAAFLETLERLVGVVSG